MMNDMYLLADVPEENKFFLRNGNVVRNMKELALEFEEMDEETFSHHVTEEKNDFHSWIASSVKDETLASAIMPIKDRELMRMVLNKRVKSLETSYKRSSAKKGKQKK